MIKKRGTTLGDLMPDLRAQWDAKKAPESQEEQSSARSDTEPKVKSQIRNLTQTLRSWKKGGAEVQVMKAKPSGLRLELKPPAPPPPRPMGRHVSPNRVSSPPSPAPDPSKAPIQTRWVEPRVARPPRAKQHGRAESVPRATKSPREKLHEVSADIRSLRVGSAVSRRSQDKFAGPVNEVEGGAIATLGLDFGTAFTKAVVRWAGRHHAVNWADAVEGDDPYLLASNFSEHTDGSCALGSCVGEGWEARDGIKLRLLASESSPSFADLADAVIFVGLAFRHANQWLREARSAGNVAIRWRLHLGLPTQAWDDSGITASFKTVAQAARLVACSQGNITRQAATNALARAHMVERPAVDVFPEFASQLYSYLRSSERQDDLHALVDIGAGTIDVAFFNVFVRNDETLLPIFAASVEPLGAHVLIAALAGRRGTALHWDDGDSSMSDADVARKCGDSQDSICGRRSLFLSIVAELFNASRQRAKLAYETSPAFSKHAAVRLFLCGGGSRIAAFRNRFTRIQVESESRVGVKFQISELVRPKDIVGDFGANFDRLSVAYGLSQTGANIGNVMRSADLQPLRAVEVTGSKHRDDDR